MGLLEGAVVRRFVFASFAFVSLTVLTTFALALLAAPARPAPADDRPGCERSLAQALAEVQATQARLKTAGADACTITRQYFLEVVKARAVMALCKTGADRERELGRLDADVERINGAIASACR
jgi:hypothetical protein